MLEGNLNTVKTSCGLALLATVACSPEIKIYWWLSFVTDVDEGAVTADYICSSNEDASLYTPADVTTWYCE